MILPIRPILSLTLVVCALLAADPAPPPACPSAGADAAATDQTALVDRMLKEIEASGKQPVKIDPKQRQAMLDAMPGATPAEVDEILAELYGNAERMSRQMHADLAGKIRASEDGTASVWISNFTFSDDKGKASSYAISTRNGKPWLVASRDGKEVFSGPVGTAEERALVPEELIAGAQGLGLDFTVKHQRTEQGESLEVRTGGEGRPAASPQ